MYHQQNTLSGITESLLLLPGNPKSKPPYLPSKSKNKNWRITRKYTCPGYQLIMGMSITTPKRKQTFLHLKALSLFLFWIRWVMRYILQYLWIIYYKYLNIIFSWFEFSYLQPLMMQIAVSCYETRQGESKCIFNIIFILFVVLCHKLLCVCFLQ